MTTVGDLLSYINSIAPPDLRETWDNVGLNCGHLEREVRTVLVALDPFAAVCREAAELGADLLVTHHALLWHPGFLTDQDEQGKNALFLIEHGIAHINAHTNLDHAPGGVNDALARRLRLNDCQVLFPKGTDANGRPWGLLRAGVAEEQPLSRFLRTVSDVLGCPGLRYVSGGRPVRRVAVGGGSCGDFLYDAARAGCDTFVTADVKYNQFWDAQNLGLNLIDAGHFYTENPVCAVLAERLRQAFPEIRTLLSAVHADCMKFYEKC